MKTAFVRIIPRNFAAGESGVNLPHYGNFLRVIKADGFLTFSLGDGSTIDLAPGMGVNLPESQAFETLRISRSNPEKAESVLFAVGWQKKDEPIILQDNRAVADITNIASAPAITAPAPLSWRIVPHIRHELLYVDRQPVSHWTEQPGKLAIYGAPAWAGNELAFTTHSTGSLGKSVCIALANPRVVRRRVRLVGFADSGATPDGVTSGTTFGGSETGVRVRLHPESGFRPYVIGGDFHGGIELTAAAPLDIEGGSALHFYPAIGEFGQDVAYAFEIQEWYYPEEIPLPRALDNWPAATAPAQWGKMIGLPGAPRTGTQPGADYTLSGPGEGPPPEGPPPEAGPPPEGPPEGVTEFISVNLFEQSPGQGIGSWEMPGNWEILVEHPAFPNGGSIQVMSPYDYPEMKQSWTPWQAPGNNYAHKQPYEVSNLTLTAGGQSAPWGVYLPPGTPAGTLCINYQTTLFGGPSEGLEDVPPAIYAEIMFEMFSS